MTKHIATLLLALGVLTACSDQDYTENNKGLDELTLTVQQQTATLDEQYHASTAATLNWTTGNNAQTGNKIYYTLQLAKAGSGYVDAYTVVDREAQLYTWSINQENLNNIILDHMGGQPGRQADIDARVIATVPGVEAPQMSELTFSAVPYQAVTTTLYLIGDATPGGWNADNAAAMTRTDNGIFTWEGQLTAGSLKFITTLGQFLPSYNNDGNGQAILRSSYDEPDQQWIITEPHCYKLTVNLLTGQVAMEPTDGAQPLYDQLYLVGNMTGWGFEPMTQDALDPFLFRMGRVFDQGGEFKFGTSNGSWENMYKATQANAPYTDTTTELVAGFDPDNKWYLQDDETGLAYKICVDTHQGKERMLMSVFTPYDMIYMVGDAAPCGWDLGNATAMTATDSPYVFTWEGQLQAGELKFSFDKQSDWNGAWLMCAAGNDVEPSGQTEHALFIDKSNSAFMAQYSNIEVGAIDQKWQISQSGTYTITVNQLEETVSIIKK